MDKSEGRKIVQEYLCDIYGCKADALSAEGVCFTTNSMTEEPYIKILGYERCIVVNASTDMFTLVETLLTDKTRDEIFECPLVYGQTIHYIPDIDLVTEPDLLDGYSYELLQGEEINKLAHVQGFDNSIAFDNDGRTTSKIAFVARKDNAVIGVAGAGAATEKLWEVGIDVNLECRNKGLGSMLTRRLTWEILKKGILPFYSASITNIGSQMVASRAGYIPCWIDTFGIIYDKNYAYNYKNVMKIVDNIVTHD